MSSLLPLSSGIFQYRYSHCYEKSLADQEYPVDGPCISERYSADAEGCTEKIDEEHSFSFITEERVQSVMQVVFPDILYPIFETFYFAGENSFNGYIEHVEYEDPEDQDGRCKGDDGVMKGPVTFDGQGSQGEAQENTSRITQKNGSRPLELEIVGQETKAASDHGNRDPSHKRLICLECNNTHKEGQDGADSRCQSVHAVEKI